MRALSVLITVVLLVVSISMLNASTIHVPADQATIQAGIDSAVDGDTVLVADGTYTGDGNRNIDFLGKAIVVMSENGYETTIIDCQYIGRGFHIHSGEGQSSLVQGLTIRNGGARLYGTGIYCENNSSPTILNCRFQENFSEKYGGGIHCDGNSSPEILHCHFQGNFARDSGGGICCDYSSPKIYNCSFQDNIVLTSGGGIGIRRESLPLIERCVFISNHGFGYAGGIECHYSDATVSKCYFHSNSAVAGGAMRIVRSDASISDCIIEGNYTEAWGGGIDIRDDASPIIYKCIIRNNDSGIKGGGILISEFCFPQITRCLINNNSSSSGGGIFCRFNSELTVVNCTVAQNQDLSGTGGAVALELAAYTNFTNSILWNNVPGEIEIIDGSLDITYSDIEGGWPGNGNIDEDPMFVLPDNGDYRLLWDSPCIDTGHPDSSDPDGTRIDMGAHPFNQNDYLTLYMTTDTKLVAQGGQMGATYTIINRWQQKEPFSVLTGITLPDGEVRTVHGPENYEICADHTAQFHVTYDIPTCAYLGMYEYQGAIGVPPSTLYDRDSFKFVVVE